MKLEYEKQVSLLIKCSPFIFQIDCFAINFLIAYILDIYYNLTERNILMEG